MLNSTKTWQERFDDIFGENHHKICIGKNCECHKVIKQFISDLRKRDMEELIKMIDEYFRHLIIIPRPDLTGKKLLQLIKDYYEN